MNNIYRIIAVLIYPLLLFFTFFAIWRKSKYKQTIIKNFKPLIINTTFILILFSLFIFLFLKQENTIYTWDYSGHWVRSLTLRDIFFTNPQNLFNEVYKSINYLDYSYLPSLFTLPFTIINASFTCFCIGNFLAFFVPLFVLLQILYYSNYDKYRLLPSLIFIIIFPLYYPLLEGKPCGCGLLFLTASYMLIFFQDLKEIDSFDSISVNLFMYIIIFERRWYLYAVIVLYLSFFIKYLLSIKSINNRFSYFIFKVLFSGLFLLIAVLLFNKPFFTRVLNNNYSEIYSTYNKAGKLINFINYYSILVCIVSMIGFIVLYKKNKILFVINLICLTISTALFWNVQSFETHHYYISMLNIIIVFTCGLYFIVELNKKFHILLLCVLIIQSVLVFTDAKAIPLLTTVKHAPKQIDNIEEYRDFCDYMKNLLGKDDVAYICGSSSLFNEDIIRNSQLPDLEMPTFEYAQVDLVDGFPNGLDYIRYILIPEPFQYFDKDSQHVHEILANAIQNKKEFKEIYQLYDSQKIGNIKVNIYEKQGNYTHAMKQFLFDEIIKYYPNNSEIFKEVLE